MGRFHRGSRVLCPGEPSGSPSWDIHDSIWTSFRRTTATDSEASPDPGALSLLLNPSDVDLKLSHSSQTSLGLRRKPGQAAEEPSPPICIQVLLHPPAVGGALRPCLRNLTWVGPWRADGPWGCLLDSSDVATVSTVSIFLSPSFLTWWRALSQWICNPFTWFLWCFHSPSSGEKLLCVQPDPWNSKAKI